MSGLKVGSERSTFAFKCTLLESKISLKQAQLNVWKQKEELSCFQYLIQILALASRLEQRGHEIPNVN